MALQHQETLSEYVRRIINEKGLNYREVARRSGGAISHGAVGYIVNTPDADARKDTLIALAKGLEVPEEEIFAVARGKQLAGEGDPEVERDRQLLLWMFDDLPRECQLDVMASVAGIHQRRALSARISERHEARAAARETINEMAEHIPTQPTLTPHPSQPDMQVASLPVRDLATNEEIDAALNKDNGKQKKAS